MGLLDHSGVVRVFDLIEAQKRLGLVMELIEGKSLSAEGDEIWSRDDGNTCALAND